MELEIIYSESIDEDLEKDIKRCLGKIGFTWSDSEFDSKKNRRIMIFTNSFSSSSKTTSSSSSNG